MATKKKKVKYLPTGVIKINKGAKAAWVASESINGWSLGLSINGTADGKTRWLRGLRFSTRAEIERVINSSIVFVHTKDSKTVPTKKGK